MIIFNKRLLNNSQLRTIQRELSDSLFLFWNVILFSYISIHKTIYGIGYNEQKISKTFTRNRN
jgi:hypothetical protein